MVALKVDMMVVLWDISLVGGTVPWKVTALVVLKVDGWADWLAENLVAMKVV